MKYNIILNNILGILVGILLGIGHLVYTIAVLAIVYFLGVIFFGSLLGGIVLILFAKSTSDVLLGLCILFILYVFWKITDDEKENKDENR